MGAGSGSIAAAAAAGRRVARGAAVCSGTVALVAGGCIAVVVGLSTSKGARVGEGGSSGAVGGIAIAVLVEAVEAVGARRVFALPGVPINEGKKLRESFLRKYLLRFCMSRFQLVSARGRGGGAKSRGEGHSRGQCVWIVPLIVCHDCSNLSLASKIQGR